MKQVNEGHRSVKVVLRSIKRRHPQLSLATRGEDWASQGQPKGVAPDPAESRGSPPTPQDPSPLRGIETWSISLLKAQVDQRALGWCCLDPCFSQGLLSTSLQYRLTTWDCVWAFIAWPGSLSTGGHSAQHRASYCRR